jgi:ADP-ribose pyrophosphatase
MERISSRTTYEGRLSAVREEEYRYADGTTSLREVVVHPGAVTMLAYDERAVHMVRQPREAVGEERLLELPAGKLDVEGEEPLEAAKRELAEEVGKRAARWRELKRFYVSPGVTTEVMWLFEATELTNTELAPDDEERIEVVGWPLDDLDGAIAECADSKSLIGLLMLREMRAAAQ